MAVVLGDNSDLEALKRVLVLSLELVFLKCIQKQHVFFFLKQFSEGSNDEGEEEAVGQYVRNVPFKVFLEIVKIE